MFVEKSAYETSGAKAMIMEINDTRSYKLS